MQQRGARASTQAQQQRTRAPSAGRASGGGEGRRLASRTCIAPHPPNPPPASPPPHPPPPPQGGYKYHQYQVVGRHLPTDKTPEPPIYRMKLWATDPVCAKSKFW